VAATKKQRGGVIRLRTDVTRKDLERIARTEERRTDTPKTLKRSAIMIADDVFQWRPYDEDMQASEDHVRALVRSIGAGKERKALDPVLVTAVGQSFYLVDGHHRMEAYHTAKWSKAIPVEVFKGSLSDARDEAFARYLKDKLPMSLQAKLQAAWVRFNEQDLSWNMLKDRFGVSRSTIANMARRRKELLEAGKDPFGVPWKDAQTFEADNGEEFDFNAFVAQAAREMADQLKKVGNFTKRPEITALAIKMVSEAMPQELARCWSEEGGGSWEGEEATETLEPDIVTALTIVTGQLQARGQGALARQIEEALQEAIAARAERFRL